MKQSMQIEEMEMELTRQQESKADWLVGTDMMMLDEDAQTIVMASEEGTNRYVANDWAHQQIGTHLGIPRKHYTRLQQDHPDLLSYTVSELFHREPKDRLVRTIDGSVRAFLSNSYFIYDGIDLLRAFTSVDMSGTDLEVRSCHADADGFTLKVGFPNMVGDIKKGEPVSWGVTFKTSEIGKGHVYMCPHIMVLACTNGMVVEDKAFKKLHRGAAMESGENFISMSERTKREKQRFIVSYIQDAVEQMTQPDMFADVLYHLQGAAGRRSSDVPRLVENTVKEFKMTENQQWQVMGHLQGNSHWDLTNAITRTAEDQDSYEEAHRLEAVGYNLARGGNTMWAKLTAAA